MRSARLSASRNALAGLSDLDTTACAIDFTVFRSLRRRRGARDNKARTELGGSPEQ